jgi:hypothetical protein
MPQDHLTNSGAQMNPIDQHRIVRAPTQVGPVRWTITAFGGCIFAAVVLLAGFNLTTWAVHRLDHYLHPQSTAEPPPLFQRF